MRKRTRLTLRVRAETWDRLYIECISEANQGAFSKDLARTQQQAERERAAQRRNIDLSDWSWHYRYKYIAPQMTFSETTPTSSATPHPWTKVARWLHGPTYSPWSTGVLPMYSRPQPMFWGCGALAVCSVPCCLL